MGYEVLFTFLNLQSSDLLNETIEEELDISTILAEQIVEEIEERIFAWAMKKIEQRQEPEINTLDVPPQNLPGEEIVEASKETPIQTTSEPMIEKVAVPPRNDVKDFFAPTPMPIEGETESRPITPKPIPVITPPPVFKPSFIANKLTQATKLAPTTPIEIPKTYTTDPYREPLE